MRNFRTFNLAVQFYRQCRRLQLKGELRSQLDRASSSIALNLAEARGKSSQRDQLKFFDIAMGSVRESQGILILGELDQHEAWQTLDHLAASLYRLIQSNR